MDRDYRIHCKGESTIAILREAKQHVTAKVLQLGARARTRAAAGSRKDIGDLREIDVRASNFGKEKLGEGQRRMCQLIQYGAAWDAARLGNMGLREGRV